MGMATVYYHVVISHAAATWAPSWPGRASVTYSRGDTNIATKYITLPPKNWRWFHMLRQAVARALPIAQVQAMLAPRPDLDRRQADAPRHKRKRFIQSLRSAA